jgi:hypothetical protein
MIELEDLALMFDDYSIEIETVYDEQKLKLLMKAFNKYTLEELETILNK